MTWMQLSLQVLVTFALFYLMLPSALSMTLTSGLSSSDSSEGQLVDDRAIMPTIIRKRSSGADAWSLCPRGMQRVDCFYEYLRVYARLRKAASQADSVSVRNIGKRTSSGPSVTPTKQFCSEHPESDLCSLFQLNLFMKGFAQAFTEEVEGGER